MDEKIVNQLLSDIPGAKRAKSGVILPAGEGGFFHVLNAPNKVDCEGLTEDEMFFVSICPRKEILRLRSLRSTHDYLLYLRANAIADSPRYVRVFIERKAKFEDDFKPWSLTHYYHSQDHYKKSFIDRLPRSSAKKVRGMAAGMALVQEANAVCRRTFVGDVILVSESLQWFFYYMRIGLVGELYEISSADKMSALLIAIRIMLGNESLDFDLDSRGDLPKEIERTIQSHVSQQMAFTFGHEFGHTVCGHLAEQDGPDYLTYNHKCEFEADAWAISEPNYKNHELDIALDAALSTLSCLYFLDAALNSLSSVKLSVSDTHPSPEDRMTSLWKRFKKKTSLPAQTIETKLKIASSAFNAVNKTLPRMQEDTLTVYGSVYLPTYKKRILKDRIEI